MYITYDDVTILMYPAQLYVFVYREQSFHGANLCLCVYVNICSTCMYITYDDVTILMYPAQLYVFIYNNTHTRVTIDRT